jgi:hypothetical protein
MLAVETATLMQLAAIVPPVFPERTIFGQGIDGVAAVQGEPPR